MSKFNGLVQFNEFETSVLFENLHPFSFKKKDFLLNIGEVNDKIYWLTKGIVREFILDKDHKEITVWFGFEGDVVASLSSMVFKKGSQTGLQALEACEGFFIKSEKLYELFDKYHKFERLGRIVTEQYLLNTETYHYDFHHLTANERFEKLQQEKSWIFNRVPLNLIASYLGISNETLSRLRAKKA